MLGALTVLGCFFGVLHAELVDTDYRGEYMSVPGDQASCGGCYGFAEAAVIEWFAANTTGKLIPLSTQLYVDCMEDDYGNDVNGCSGGVVTDGLKYLLTYQYHPYAEDYPFTGDWNSQTCIDNGVKDRKRRNALADVWVFNYIPLSKTAQAMREALQNGPVIASMYIGEEIFGWDGATINTDTTCATNPAAHALTFVGWQSNSGNPYYVIRNSYSEYWADKGYANYADNVQNTYCNYQNQAVTLSVGRRHEIEYRLGSGKKKFDDARAACQALDGDSPADRGGWDLAVIPTQMHNFEVYELFTRMYGSDKKGDDSYNNFWIGMFKQQWVDGTDVNYVNWFDYKFKFFHTVMMKVHPGNENRRGKWTTRSKVGTYRFVCSRYRQERCPRISQTAVDNAETLTMFDAEGVVTKEIDVGTVAVVECTSETSRVGPETSKCQGDGTWTELPACKSAVVNNNCKMLTKSDIPNSKSVSGKEVEPGFVAPGSTLKVKCAKKHNLIGSGEFTCSEGDWLNIPTCEKKGKKNKKSKTKTA